MSDNYQAVYDAIRSRFYGDFVGTFENVIRQNFSVEWWRVQDEFARSAVSMQDPHVLMRPSLSVDGDQWCALYGNDLATGVAGFGNTPAAAMSAFDTAWLTAKPPKQVQP